MKKKILSAVLCLTLVLAAFVLLPTDASAETSGTCGDNLTWTLDDAGILTISGTGSMQNYSAFYSVPWYNSKDSVKKVVIGDSVTSIGDRAFAYCSNLTSVTIGESVTSIGNYAFYGCGNLTSVTIPDSVTNIGDSAFCDCSNLTNVTIPDSVTNIGDSAFNQCNRLTGIWVDEKNNHYSSDAYGVLFNKSKTTLIQAPGDIVWDYTIPDSVTTIGDCAFRWCDLFEITIPDSVTTIGDGAFSCCYMLLVTIPDSVTTIGDGAFFSCFNLRSVTIGESVTSIGDSAFSSCDRLSSITFPDSVTSIGDSAFSDCDNLTSVTIGDNVTTIGSGAFGFCDSLNGIWVDENNNHYSSDAYGVLFNKSKTTLIQAPGTITEYIIPYSVTTVRYSAFEGCTSLTSVIIRDSITTIYSCAFRDCSCLSKIVFEGSAPRYLDSNIFYNVKATVYYPENDESWKDSARQNYGGTIKWVAINPVPEGLDYIISDGKGVITDYTGTATELVIPATIEGYPIVTIGDDAFHNCDSLTSVTIPDSVTNIGDYAFYDCDSLTSVTILDSVTNIGDHAFYDCNSLTSVTIPDSVTSIGTWAFHGCSDLTSVTIGESVTSIGDYALDGCNGLTGIWVDENNKCYSSDAYGVLFNKSKTTLLQAPGRIVGDYTIPDSVTTIDDGAFSGCTDLTSISIPNSVISIGDWAFSGCSDLTSVTIGESVTSIGDSAFDSCSSLRYNIYGNGKYLGNANNPYYAFIDTIERNITSIEIHSGTKIVAGSAIYDCDSLTSVTIPDSVISIGDDAFYDCDSLTNVTIPDSVTNIGDHAFFNCDSLRYNIYGNGKYLGNDNNLYYALVGTVKSNIISIKIHSGTKIVAGSAFYYCHSLTSVTIPYSVTSIGNLAFYGCDRLTSITIPDSVTTIGKYSFAFCSSLTSVTIGDSVTNIGYNAFYFCDSLKTVYYTGTMKQWKAIVIDSGNDNLTNADIIYKPYFGRVDTWNLILKEDIGVKFEMEFTDTILEDKNAYVEINVVGKIKIIPVSSASKGIKIDVAPAQMTDEIKICIVSGSGIRDEVSTYSVRGYADAILSGDYSNQTKNMVRYMLNYGAMAQLYFNYNTHNLANITGTAATEVPETAEELAVSDKLNNLDFYGASLVYRDRIAVRYYFTGDVAGLTFGANGIVYTPVAKDGMYYVEIAYIQPQNLDQQIPLIVIDANGNALTVTYGPMNYIVRMNEKGSAELKNLVKALYNYHLAAKALV